MRNPYINFDKSMEQLLRNQCNNFDKTRMRRAVGGGGGQMFREAEIWGSGGTLASAEATWGLD